MISGVPITVGQSHRTVVGKKVKFTTQSSDPKSDVAFLREVVESRKFRPVIDRCFPLEDVVEATRYVETERKVGNVVLTVNRETTT